jgi:photosystem II stability/assembly factor-like uncharacterized protein
MKKRAHLFTTLAFAATLIAGCSNSNPSGAWVVQDTGTGDSFYSANFVNENVGWLNGMSGRNEAPDENENANKNPKPKKPGEKTPLQANQGFEILQTTDGGATWKAMPDQFKNKIRSVWFTDPQSGWALTIDRNILHTSDGGATWAVQRTAGTVKLKLLGNRREPVSDQPDQIDHIHFIDASHGWAWGGGKKDEAADQPGILLQTIDGGAHWNDIPYPFEQDTSALFFLDAQHGWASTEDGGFYTTTDGGVNWSKVQTKMPGELVFRAIFFVDLNNGWLVGRSGRIAKTTDGGRTWRKMYEIKDEFKMRDIFFTDRSHGWTVGEDGAILYTPDAGESWLKVDSPIPAKFTDVVFVGKYGWAVGLSGALLRFEPK